MMGPIIILDKSAFHALSYSDAKVLHELYLVNIVPVLCIEILGDLKKLSKKSLSKEKVMELSNKILPQSKTINVNFRAPFIASLFGEVVPMDRRPHILGGRNVKYNDGQKGTIIEESPEEKAIMRWREGKFEQVEEILADSWRSTTRGFDINQYKENQRKIFNLPKFRSLNDLNSFIDEVLDNKKNQLKLFEFLIIDFQLDFQLAGQIFHRWENANKPLLKYFAPYAFYCLKVNIFFKAGLSLDLITTRPTNLVDLQYLYYLPFCMIFASADNFHSQIVPFFLNPDQDFVDGRELKLDLEKISEEWKERDLADIDYLKSNKSLTVKLWHRFMKCTIPEQRRSALKLSNEKKKEIVEMIIEKINKSKNLPDSTDFHANDADFVIRKSTIRAIDPCPCGSGKQLKDCCWEKIHKSHN